LGNDRFDSEELVAYEIGYRWQASSVFSLDLATFYNRYDGLASVEPATPFLAPDGRTIVPIEYRNLTTGDAWGMEALMTYAPRENWRLTGKIGRASGRGRADA